MESDGFTVARDLGGGIDLHDGVALVVDSDEAFVPLWAKVGRASQ